MAHLTYPKANDRVTQVMIRRLIQLRQQLTQRDRYVKVDLMTGRVYGPAGEEVVFD